MGIGDTVNYNIRVTNTGDVTLHNVTVVDAKLGIDQNVGTLAPGAFVDVAGSYGPVTESDLPGPIENTASADSGETDPIGLRAAKDRVHINQFHATLLHLMGLDHRRLTYEHHGLEERLTGPTEVDIVEGLLS